MGDRSPKSECIRVDEWNDFFFHQVFEWRPIWFDDLLENIKTDEILSDKCPLSSTKLEYSDHEDYSKVWKPLILLEFFHGLMKDLDEDGQVNKKRPLINIQGKITTESRRLTGSYKFKTFMVEIELLKNVKDDCYPQRGDLVHVNYEGNVQNKIFAYVENVDTFKLYKLMRLITKANVIIPKNRTVLIDTGKSISQYLRMLRALNDLSSSQLFPALMRPNFIDYSMDIGKKKPILHLLDEKKLNITQLNIMKDIVKTIEDHEPRICLVQGPPGTGKSTLIINIVKYLVVEKKCKILLCAPSNKAIDGVVLRLLKIKNDLLENEKVDIDIVRIGREDKIDPNVKELSLSNRLLGKRFENLSVNGKKTADHHRMEEQILLGADIIASTLTSSFTNKMEYLFGRFTRYGRALPLCIVDEAGQCTEAALNIPLLLGVEKLILVGDPQQLPPTIISQDAKNSGMDVSLFRRAQKNFEKSKYNPIRMLDVQYRMDDSIALWPNKYFYGGKIQNEPHNASLNLVNYKILNHNSNQNLNKIFVNRDEAKIVMDLLKIIVEEIKTKDIKEFPSIGVITPYKDQQKEIFKILNKKVSCIEWELTREQKAYDDYKKAIQKEDKSSETEIKKCNRRRGKAIPAINVEKVEEKIEELNFLYSLWKTKIEVNTVDSFQGQERDIIIMSCVRSRGIGFVADPNRLNVSLTRAKHTLILCGNFNTFRKNVMWRNLLEDAESRGVLVEIDKNINSHKLKSLIIIAEETTEKN